ncbi:MAG: TIGR02281 family clan AA aspartic protease [Hyphomicrobium sp.]
MLGWLLLFSFLLSALFIYLGTGGEDLQQTSAIGIAAAVAFALLVLYALATRSGHDGGQRLRRLLVPLLLLGTGAGAWFYFAPDFDLASWLDRAGVATPASDVPSVGQDGLKSVLIRRNEQGQFVARSAVNGAPVDMLIDTGASSVVLKQSDAERAGLDTTALDYSVPIETANGQRNAAAVRLRTLTIGALQLNDLEALVAQPGSLNENLLGMSFLRRLRSYEISGDFMTLRE